MADPNQLSGFFLPSAKEINEDHLVNQTWRAVICAGLAVLLLACIANEVGSDRHASLINAICDGFVTATCPSIGVAIALFIGWGISVAVVRRLNAILGTPLNPSAISALGAGFGYALAHSAIAAALIAHTYGSGISAEQPTVTICASAFLGSLLVQVVARISVRREIARHNMRAGRMPFKEPNCQVRFQIRQMMILTAAISLCLALAMHLAGGSLIVLGTLWCVLTASTFFPAIVIAKWVDSKLRDVQLKPWEEVRTIDWETELAAAKAEFADGTSLASSNTITTPTLNTEQPLWDPLPQQHAAARYTTSVALSAAGMWVSLAGGFFCVLFVISLEISQAMQGNQLNGLMFAPPLAVGGMLVGLFLAGIAMALLQVFNFVTGDKMQTGTIAAFTGGAVGALGASLVLSFYEMVHAVPFNGAIDCFAENNRFPLAMLLLASFIGQTFARLGVKRCGHKCGLSNEDCLAESSGPAWGRFSILTGIIAICGWLLVIANNDASVVSMLNPDDHLTSFSLAIVASIATVWPLANLLARRVNLSPKASLGPAFLRLLQPSQTKAPF